jgi:hypothetical protein
VGKGWRTLRDFGHRLDDRVFSYQYVRNPAGDLYLLTVHSRGAPEVRGTVPVVRFVAYIGDWVTYRLFRTGERCIGVEHLGRRTSSSPRRGLIWDSGYRVLKRHQAITARIDLCSLIAGSGWDPQAAATSWTRYGTGVRAGGRR